MATIFSASYPVKSGDYDEFASDHVCVMAEDADDFLDLGKARPMARFAASDAMSAMDWLTSHGCPPQDAGRIVARAIDGRTSERVVLS